MGNIRKPPEGTLKGALSRLVETRLYLSVVALRSALLRWSYHIARTSAAQRRMHTQSDPNPVVGEEVALDSDLSGT